MCVVSVPAVSLKPAASASDLRGEGPREAWGPDPPTPGHGTVGASKAETWAPGRAHTPWGHWLAGDGGGSTMRGLSRGCGRCPWGVNRWPLHRERLCSGSGLRGGPGPGRAPVG